MKGNKRPSKQNQQKKKNSRKERSLFAELQEGMLALKDHREGRITLRQRTVRPLVLPTIDGRFITEAREARGMSRAVFALKLGLSPRSLERWEQDLSPPPGAVAALILMAAKFPDTFERLASIEQPTATKANATLFVNR